MMSALSKLPSGTRRLVVVAVVVAVVTQALVIVAGLTSWRDPVEPATSAVTSIAKAVTTTTSAAVTTSAGPVVAVPGTEAVVASSVEPDPEPEPAQPTTASPSTTASPPTTPILPTPAVKTLADQIIAAATKTAAASNGFVVETVVPDGAQEPAITNSLRFDVGSKSLELSQYLSSTQQEVPYAVFGDELYVDASSVGGSDDKVAKFSIAKGVRVDKIGTDPTNLYNRLGSEAGHRGGLANVSVVENAVGEAGTHFTATLDPKAALLTNGGTSQSCAPTASTGMVKPLGRLSLAAAMGELCAAYVSLKADYWVDAAGLLRRVTLSGRSPAGVVLTDRQYSDLGTAGVIEKPPSEIVVDGASLLK